jgi:hypothetical protein
MRSAQKFAGNNQNWQSEGMNKVQDGGLAAATGESHRAKNKTTDDYESAEKPRNISNYYRK